MARFSSLRARVRFVMFHAMAKDKQELSGHTFVDSVF